MLTYAGPSKLSHAARFGEVPVLLSLRMAGRAQVGQREGDHLPEAIVAVKKGKANGF
jgi:hypothetical protein